MRAQNSDFPPIMPHADPVVRLLRVMRVRILGFVYPLIRIEFVGLEYVRQPAGFAEATIRQFVHGFSARFRLKSTGGPASSIRHFTPFW